MKNTTGYSLNAFLDFERAVDIFQHVLIGSEGTLAFIAEAVLNTVPDLPVKYTGLLLFPDLYAAAASIVPLRQAGAKALEIMDRASLRSVEDQAGIPASIRKLAGWRCGPAGRSSSRPTRRSGPSWRRLRADAVGGLKLLRAGAVHPRRGRAGAAVEDSRRHVSVGGLGAQERHHRHHRGRGVPRRGAGRRCADLTKLFRKHELRQRHHLRPRQGRQPALRHHPGFNDQAAIDQYARFIDDVVELVVERYDGALKAEHGTGRNMAPFVETEWGGEGYAIMRRLKELADPRQPAEPGRDHQSRPPGPPANLKQLAVGRGRDRQVHRVRLLRAQVPQPRADADAAPAHRGAARDGAPGSMPADGRGRCTAALEREFPYMALDTCATDGLCATACPVSIDTGQAGQALPRARARCGGTRVGGAHQPRISRCASGRCAWRCAWDTRRRT